MKWKTENNRKDKLNEILVLWKSKNWWTSVSQDNKGENTNYWYQEVGYMTKAYIVVQKIIRNIMNRFIPTSSTN